MPTRKIYYVSISIIGAAFLSYYFYNNNESPVMSDSEISVDKKSAFNKYKDDIYEQAFTLKDSDKNIIESNKLVSMDDEFKNSPIGIFYQKERLSINVDQYPLGPALEEISKLSGVAISGDSVSGNDLLSIKFDALPIDKGLQKILADNDVFFLYGTNVDADEHSLNAVWVFDKGQGMENIPVSKASTYASSSIDVMLTDESSYVRASALESSIDNNPEQAVSTVLSAMADPNGDVRSRVLYKAIQAEVELTTDALEGFLQNDSDPMVRVFALDALSQKLMTSDVHRLEELAKLSINDSEILVRESAQDIIDHILSSDSSSLIDEENNQQGADDTDVEVDVHS
jgi:hypothetical protein